MHKILHIYEFILMYTYITYAPDNYVKHFTSIISFNPYKNFAELILLSSLYYR